jgi:hypothetical protein
MNLLAETRQLIITQLWQTYLSHVEAARQINAYLNQKLVLDHFAIIDLPGIHSGISQLKQIFNMLNFQECGSGYLPDKQNDFIWLCEENSDAKIASEVLPQIVIADFRLDELPSSVRMIIESYAKYIPPIPLSDIQLLSSHVKENNHSAKDALIAIVLKQISGRAWPTPSIRDYQIVKEANELLAWALVFGRQVNHFGIAIHHLAQYKNLKHFNDAIKTSLGIRFNANALEIKGNQQLGIEQSSTADNLVKVTLEDGILEIPSPFAEFVWRFPKIPHTTALLWKDYYTDFYAPNANHVIESVYKS